MTVLDARKRLTRRLRRVQLDPSPDVVEGLLLYYDLLYRWNAKINLTSLPDGDEAVDRLLVEPLLAVRLLSDSTGLLLDVGSGGGSPAIPLKLSVPTVQLWMVEAKARKSAFLREAVRQLGLSDVHVAPKRLDDVVGEGGVWGLADTISLRGVRADLKLLTSLHTFLRPSGQILFFSTLDTGTRLQLPPQLQFIAEHPLMSALQTCVVV
ncbi:MAG: 16S rRNA (guanine(527)-N(7))-methyltransferase RsmG, partial [Vicinamibacterales bacterium]